MVSEVEEIRIVRVGYVEVELVPGFGLEQRPGPGQWNELGLQDPLVPTRRNLF